MSLRLLSATLLTALAAPAAAGEIRGRVLVDGKPASGVAVSVLPFEDGFAAARREARREDVPKALASGATRPDGTFAVAVPAAAGTAVRLAFSGATAVPRVLEALFDAGGEDAGDVRLPRATPLAGRVVDERGGPVVGATVTLWPGGGRRPQDASPGRGVPQAATTKADGAFRFEAAGEEANRLRVEAPAFATLEREPVRGGALARPVTLVLGQVLRGTVTLADRRTPAAGALVRFEGRTQTTRWVETRADGTFLVDGAPREAGSLVADGGTAAAPRRCCRRAPPSPSRSPSPPPRRSAGASWTPPTERPSPASASWPGARAGSSSRARPRTAATRSAASRPGPTGSRPRTTASCPGRAR